MGFVEVRKQQMEKAQPLQHTMPLKVVRWQHTVVNSCSVRNSNTENKSLSRPLAVNKVVGRRCGSLKEHKDCRCYHVYKEMCVVGGIARQVWRGRVRQGAGGLECSSVVYGVTKRCGDVFGSELSV